MSAPSASHSLSIHRGDDDDMMVQEEDLAMIREMPPMSSYVSKIRFWSTFAFVPTVFIFANFIAMTKLISFDELSDSSSRSHDWVQTQFKRNTFYASLILMVDAALLYRSAMSLERDVEARNDSIRCQVSEMMDKFLGHPKIRRTSTTTTPVLVSLLYLIASICCIGGLVSIALRVYGVSAHFADHCSLMKRRERKEQDQEKDVPGLPAELQSWAKDSLWSRGGTYGNERKGASYMHLKDGRTFFAARSHTPEKKEDGEDIWDDVYEYGYQRPSLAVIGPKDASVTVYPDAKSPSDFKSLNGENDVEESIGFCCIYEDNDQARHSAAVRRRVMHDGGGGTHRILCAVSFEEDARNTSMPGENRKMPMGRNNNKHLYLQGGAANGFGGLYWYYIRWHYEDCSISRCFGKDMLEFFRLDPVTMNATSVAEVSVESEELAAFNDFGSSNKGICTKFESVIAGSVAALVAVSISFYLTKIKQLPAGIIPVLLSGLFVLYSINYELSSMIRSVALLATSYFLIFGKIPKWTNREAVCWCHYSLFLFYLFEQGFEPGLAMICCLVIGVILNHPILQIAGYVVAPASIIFALIETYVHYIPFIEAFATIVPLTVLVGCGMVSAGQTLRKYRAYINFYARRLWTGITTAMRESISTGRSTSSGGDGEANEDLTRRLI